jgi:hypothetical protein
MEVLPNVIVHSNKYETPLEVVNNLRGGRWDIKDCHSIDDIHARNVVCSMVVLGNTQNINVVGNLLHYAKTWFSWLRQLATTIQV